jgi:hypothetical protein
MDIDKILSGLLPFIIATILTLVKTYIEKSSRKEKEEKVEEAEKQAFTIPPDALLEQINQLKASQEGLEVKTQEITSLIDQNTRSLILGNLFNLYNKQIERYQDETRSRASWSFYIALIAMFFGFGFVFWGGQHVLTQTNWDHLAAGSAIAAIGGGISAFITKTFLGVHKLSLQQLNRYFDQPVINDHILMAQRLADNLPDSTSRQKAYEAIILSVTALIDLRAQDRENESASMRPVKVRSNHSPEGEKNQNNKQSTGLKSRRKTGEKALSKAE